MNGSFLLLRQFRDPAAARAFLGVHGGPDGDELGDVAAEFLHLDVQPDADDPVRTQFLGLGFHPAHRQLARVIHGLRQDIEFLVLAPPPDLQPDVVDRAAQHQAERAETDLPHQQELIDRQIRREDRAGTSGTQLRQAPHRVLRYSLQPEIGARLVSHCAPWLPCCRWLGLVPRPVRGRARTGPGGSGEQASGGHQRPSRTRAAWRRCGSSERIARLGPCSGRPELVNCAVAVPMMVTSTM